MKKERYFEATEFENIKEIIYNSAEKYGENTAFILKHKKDRYQLLSIPVSIIISS